MGSDDHILGLRAQIKANAAVLFPSAGTSNNGGAGPDDFEVIITKSLPRSNPIPYRACLVIGANGRNTVAASNYLASVESALHSLLALLSEVLAKAGRNLLSDVANFVDFPEGEIDIQMAILE